MQKGKIKSSAAALPRIEPWLHIIASTPTPLLTILQNRCNGRLESIEHQGERGDGRDLKAQFSPLECSHCGAVKDCAKVRLYTTCAKGVTCSTCTNASVQVEALARQSRSSSQPSTVGTWTVVPGRFTRRDTP